MSVSPLGRAARSRPWLFACSVTLRTPRRVLRDDVTKAALLSADRTYKGRVMREPTRQPGRPVG